jgi:hypothetical protein
MLNAQELLANHMELDEYISVSIGEGIRGLADAPESVESVFYALRPVCRTQSARM